MKKFFIAAICAVAATTFGAYAQAQNIKTVAPRLENGLHAPTMSAGATALFNKNKAAVGATAAFGYSFGKAGGAEIGVQASCSKSLYWDKTLSNKSVNASVFAYYKQNLGVFNAYDRLIPAMTIGVGVAPQDQWQGIETEAALVRHICTKSALAGMVELSANIRPGKNPQYGVEVAAGCNITPYEGTTNNGHVVVPEGTGLKELTNPLKRSWVTGYVSVRFRFSCYRTK